MNENKNIEGMMYNSDGSFKPLTGNEGNTSGELAHLRNTYMESEKAYFGYLLSDKNMYMEFVRLINEPSESLLQCAMMLQEKLEYGNLETEEEKKAMQSMSPQEREKYHMRKLEKAEGMMCLLFAAARDKAKVLELVRTYEQNKGRTR